MKKVQKLKKVKFNNAQQYNTQDYLLVKKAASYTRGNIEDGREGSYWSPKSRDIR